MLMAPEASRGSAISSVMIYAEAPPRQPHDAHRVNRAVKMPRQLRKGRVGKGGAAEEQDLRPVVAKLVDQQADMTPLIERARKSMQSAGLGHDEAAHDSLAPAAHHARDPAVSRLHIERHGVEAMPGGGDHRQLPVRQMRRNDDAGLAVLHEFDEVL